MQLNRSRLIQAASSGAGASTDEYHAMPTIITTRRHVPDLALTALPVRSQGKGEVKRKEHVCVFDLLSYFVVSEPEEEEIKRKVQLNHINEAENDHYIQYY